MYPVAIKLTTENLPKSFISMSGIFQEKLKVLVNATVNVALVPNVNVGVATAPEPPLTTVITWWALWRNYYLHLLLCIQ